MGSGNDANNPVAKHAANTASDLAFGNALMKVIAANILMITAKSAVLLPLHAKNVTMMVNQSALARL